jgi:ABC-type transport system involved in multi-copper enzyme maturation permease subunit
MRLGPGPVFIYEWLTTSRRWQFYALRAAFVCAILVGMISVRRIELRSATTGPNVSIQALARYGQTLYLTVITIELTVILLVAPAATAGAVCIDKMRGTLDHMLATDLSNAEIVLGKLGVRLVPVLGLIACVLPIMALSGLLGGIDPTALFGSFLAAIGCAILGCSLALTLSVWGRKTHEVLMMTYLLIILWLFSPFLLTTLFYSSSVSSLRFSAPLFWQWLQATNPYYLSWAPYSNPGSVSLTSYFSFLVCCLGLSAILIALATLRIRAVVKNQSGRLRVGFGGKWLGGRLPALCWERWLPGPSLDGNPVFWREWYRSKPSRFMRLAWTAYCALGAAWIVITIQTVTSGSINRDLIAMLNVFQVGVGLLLLSVTASTSLAEERMRSSLDVLLTTPLSTRSILTGKWAGAFRNVPALLFAPVVTALLLTGESRRWLQYVLFLALLFAYSALIVSIGLAAATWLSRLGRAVASCVAAYIALSFGWPLLVLACMLGAGANDRAILPLVLGTPLYGTLFATLGLSGPHHMPGSAADLWIGASFWIFIHGGLAAVLFAATIATFDHFLGRAPEGDLEPIRWESKARKPFFERGPRAGTWKRQRPRFDPYFDDDPAVESSAQST